MTCVCVFQWDALQRMGDDIPDDLLVGRVKQMAPNKCCSLIYTVSNHSSEPVWRNGRAYDSVAGGLEIETRFGQLGFHLGKEINRQR